MVSVEDLASLRAAAGDLDREVDGLGAGHHRMRGLEASGRAFGQLACELAFGGAEEEQAAEVLCLHRFLGRGDDRRIAVTEAEGTPHAPHVEKAIAFGIVEVGPLGRTLDKEKAEALNRLDALPVEVTAVAFDELAGGEGRACAHGGESSIIL